MGSHPLWFGPQSPPDCRDRDAAIADFPHPHQQSPARALEHALAAITTLFERSRPGGGQKDTIVEGVSMDLAIYALKARMFTLDPGTMEDLRKAVRYVRAQTPRSYLADLAERKLSVLASEQGVLTAD
jgi:hypothetical protein